MVTLLKLVIKIVVSNWFPKSFNELVQRNQTRYNLVHLDIIYFHKLNLHQFS